jgi:hypothetical protein
LIGRESFLRAAGVLAGVVAVKVVLVVTRWVYRAAVLVVGSRGRRQQLDFEFARRPALSGTGPDSLLLPLARLLRLLHPQHSDSTSALQPTATTSSARDHPPQAPRPHHPPPLDASLPIMALPVVDPGMDLYVARPRVQTCTPS